MKKHPTDTDLDFLRDCTNEELEFLVHVIIDAGKLTNGLVRKASYQLNRETPTKYVDDIIEEIQLYAGNTVLNRLRGHGVPYREALMDTLGNLGVDYDKRMSLSELEGVLIRLGLPEFLDHVKDADVREKFKSLLANPCGGASLNGDVGYRNRLKDFKDLFTWYVLLDGNAWVAWASPAKRVVVPAVLYIATLRKFKMECKNGR